MSYLLALQT